MAELCKQSINLNKEEIKQGLDLLNKILVTLVDWAGVVDKETPGDIEIISSPYGQVICLDDILDGLTVINKLKNG